MLGIDAARKSLDALPGVLMFQAAAVAILALCVVAMLARSHGDLKLLTLWMDKTLCVPAIDWIGSHIGFAHTMASVRAHMGVEEMARAISVAIACAALGLMLFAGLNLMVAIWVRNRKHFGFALWLSCLNVWFFPLGTICGAWSLSTLRKPANIAAFMRPDLKSDELLTTLACSALVEIIRMPQPFHVGLVLTYFDEESHRKQRTVWINGWFGVTLPVSLKAIVTRQSPYYMPFFPTSGPYLLDKTIVERMETMAHSVAAHLNENLMPYSFVPGVFDGLPFITAAGGHTSNSIVASLLQYAEAVEPISKQQTIVPWFFAPGANPHAPRNIMPREWFE